jgi:hypothetical protein
MMMFHSDSLKEYMESKPLEVKNKRLIYPAEVIPHFQHKLFDEISARQISGQHLNRAVGIFYEILTAAITGGIWTGSVNSSQNGGIYKPDVITEDCLYDSKAVSLMQACKLQDFQIQKALVQECTAEYIKPKRKIFIPIFKYGLTNPWKLLDEGSFNVKKNLISLLSQQTSFCLFLPLQIAYQFYRPDVPAEGYKTRYEGKKWDHETRLLSSGLKKILLSPEESLSAVKLDEDNFVIKKTHFPSEIFIGGSEIKPFPILLFDYKNGNHEEWIKSIMKEKGNEIEKIRTEKRTRQNYRDSYKGKERTISLKSEKEIDSGFYFDFSG